MKSKKYIISGLKILAAIVFWIVIWALVSYRIDIEFLFPSPIAVFKALITLLQSEQFWIITTASLLRVMIGVFASLIIGTILAYITNLSTVIHTLLTPLLSAVKSTPIASFIILALLWIDSGILPAFITALIVIPIVWANVLEGIRSVDRDLVELASLYKFSIGKKLFRLYIPTVAPYFMAACKSALGMAWKAGIAAEVIAVPESSIGKELYFSKTYMETSTLFAWTLVVILVSFIIENLFMWLLKHLGYKLRFLQKGERNAED